MRIDDTAVSTTSRRHAAELDGRADDTGAERLGEHQPVAGLRAGVGKDAIRVDGAGHRVAEFDLAILHGVAAEQRHARFAQLVEPAAEDLRRLRRCRDASCWKRRNRQRRQRPPAHGVDVAQRVGRGDLAVDVGVVHDRREEVHRLHQRRAALPPRTHRHRPPSCSRPGCVDPFVLVCRSGPERARPRRVYSLNRRS